jgi:hypothetical protein
MEMGESARIMRLLAFLFFAGAIKNLRHDQPWWATLAAAAGVALVWGAKNLKGRYDA